MKPLLDSLQLIASRKDSRLVIIIATAIFIILLLIAQNGKEALQVFDLTSYPSPDASRSSLHRSLTSQAPLP